MHYYVYIIYKFMYVCIYTYMNIYIYIHTYIYIYIYTHIRAGVPWLEHRARGGRGVASTTNNDFGLRLIGKGE